MPCRRTGGTSLAGGDATVDWGAPPFVWGTSQPTGEYRWCAGPVASAALFIGLGLAPADRQSKQSSTDIAVLESAPARPAAAANDGHGVPGQRGQRQSRSGAAPSPWPSAWKARLKADQVGPQSETAGSRGDHRGQQRQRRSAVASRHQAVGRCCPVSCWCAGNLRSGRSRRTLRSAFAIWSVQRPAHRAAPATSGSRGADKSSNGAS